MRVTQLLCPSSFGEWDMRAQPSSAMTDHIKARCTMSLRNGTCAINCERVQSQPYLLWKQSPEAWDTCVPPLRLDIPFPPIPCLSSSPGISHHLLLYPGPITAFLFILPRYSPLSPFTQPFSPPVILSSLLTGYHARLMVIPIKEIGKQHKKCQQSVYA